MRNLLALSDAADRGDPTQGHCCAWRGGSEDLVSDQCAHGGAARPLVRLPRHQARRHLSPRVSSARSPPEERSLERPADGDEGARVAQPREGCGVTETGLQRGVTIVAQQLQRWVEMKQDHAPQGCRTAWLAQLAVFALADLRPVAWAAMKNRLTSFCLVLLFSAITVSAAAREAPKPAETPASNVYPLQEGFVDANGVMIYYKILGRGEPLMIVHGGPGASHDYFLPYLLPLARHNKVVFIDERGSGRSQKLEDPAGYTIENMAEDVESVRQALGLGKINLLGHSYGGALAQAYALKYQRNLSDLILASTWSSTITMNQVLLRMKQNMAPELRERIEKMEAAGLFGHGKDYEKNRYTAEYMIAAWGEGYFPYLYQNHPDPNYDPIGQGTSAWDLYREM